MRLQAQDCTCVKVECKMQVAGWMRKGGLVHHWKVISSSRRMPGRWYLPSEMDRFLGPGPASYRCGMCPAGTRRGALLGPLPSLDPCRNLFFR